MNDVPFDVVQFGDDPQAIFRQPDRPSQRTALCQSGIALAALNLSWRATGRCPQPSTPQGAASQTASNP